MYKPSFEDIKKIRETFLNNDLKSVITEMEGENDDFYDGYFTGILHCFDIYVSRPNLRSEYHNSLALLAIAASRQFSEEFLEKIKNRQTKAFAMPNFKNSNSDFAKCETCERSLPTQNYFVNGKELKLCKFCYSSAKLLFN